MASSKERSSCDALFPTLPTADATKAAAAHFAAASSSGEDFFKEADRVSSTSSTLRETADKMLSDMDKLSTVDTRCAVPTSVPFVSSLFSSVASPVPNASSTKLSTSMPSSSKICVNKSVAYVVTPIEITTSAIVSKTSTDFACSFIASFSNAACRSSEPKYASTNAVLEEPMKCAAKNSGNLSGVMPHTYQFPDSGMGSMGHSRNSKADLKPSVNGGLLSGNSLESKRRESAPNHFVSPSFGESFHVSARAFSFKTVRPSQKLSDAAIVEAKDVAIVPPATPPKTAGDTTGKMNPIGKNSSVIVSFSAANNPTYTRNTNPTFRSWS
mmetsp:Transcript_5632/g.21316  ORF Transcript_5632/g.21316 Transcript_5632/m.21316 type:complete len:327 (+) Transcript_5632:126-1106(+)